MTKKLEESILPFIKGNDFCWPTDFEESSYCLYQIRFATNKKDLFQSGGFSEELEIVTNNWDFITIIKSALCFHLEYLKSSRKETNRPPFFWLDWYTLIYVFLNKNTSKKEILEIIEYLYEAPDRETRLGIKRAISTFTAFPFVPISPESLNNLLIFLNIDIVSREALVKEIFKKQNLNDLVNFLTTLESSVNTDLVLTEALSFYFETLENEAPSMREIEEQINNIINYTRLELETFNIFDIMDSSEQAISGSSKLYVFSFNEALLLSLIKNPSNTPLKIFELFESYLYQRKQKTLFFIKISFEKGGDLYKLISDFCFTCEKQIKLYAKSDYMKLGLTFISFVFSIIVGSLGLLLFFVSSRSVSTRTSMLDQIKAKSSGNVAYIATERFYLEEVSEKTENTLISENVLTENNKIVQMPQPSFGSIIPRFSKNQVKASQPVPITQSVALQASTPRQGFQTFESTVRPTRSTPRNTTMSYGRITREGLKGNYSTVSFQQSNIELRRVPFELQLPAQHATDLDAVVRLLQYRYPGVILNVKQIYAKKNGVYQPTTQISLVGSSLQYRDRRAIKEEISAFCKGREFSVVENEKATKLELVNPSQLEGDHTKNTVQLNMLHLQRHKAGVVFMGKKEHTLMGEKRNFLMPGEIGYTPGTAGAMDFIDFIEEDNGSVIKVIFGGDFEHYSAQGYEEEEILRGFKNASSIDREQVQERIAGWEVDENIFLAINVNSMFDDGMTKNYDGFVDLILDEGPDCKTACRILNEITIKAAPRRLHAFSVRAHLKEGTTAWREFNKTEDRLTHACERAYNLVAGMTGYSETYIDKAAKAKFLGETPDKPIPLEEAFQITTYESNLESLKNHPDPLYNPRLLRPNRKRK